MIVALVLSLLALLATLSATILLRSGLRQLERLDGQPAAGPTPSLSVIVPARDEALTLEPALRSLLSSDYPRLEVVAVDDRSGDGTGAILERLAREDPRLVVLHVVSLPQGWLGKPHALHLGAQRASGEYLLFTDADIRFEPRTLGRALAYVERHDLDHLVVMPSIRAQSPLLRMMLLQFLAAFLLMFRPWQLQDAPERYVGVGAFNLVRRRTYDAVGGHADIALTPLDDLLLGKRLRQAGARARALLAGEEVWVEWYRSAAAMVRGMGKNAFAAYDYSLLKLSASTLAVAVTTLWPLLGVIIGPGVVRLVCAATLLLGIVLLHGLIRHTDWPRWTLLLAPLATLVNLYTAWRSALLAIARGTIEWRGTRYPLDALKKSHF